MKKIFLTIFILIFVSNVGIAKKVDTTQLVTNRGYVGELPDIEESYSYKNPNSVSKPPFSSGQMPENPDEVLLSAPRDIPSYINIIIKKDRTSAYINDLNTLIPIMEKLKKNIEKKGEIRDFNAIVSNIIDHIDYIRRTYENKKECYYISYKKLMEFSDNAREVAIFRTRANVYVKYMPYTAQGAIYTKQNLDNYMTQLLQDLNKTLFVVKEAK